MQTDPTPKADTFAALADPTRLALINLLLTHGEMRIRDVTAPFALSRPAMSRHLKILEEQGLIMRHGQKDQRMVRVRREGFQALERWLRHHRSAWLQAG